MYIGVDIGGTKTLAACLDDNGVIQERSKFPTPQSYPEFLRELAKVVASFTTKEFRGGCVAVPGRIDREHGVAIACGNLPWRDVPIKADIERMVHCSIAVDNDANLAGLSEAMLLKDQFSRVLYVTVSTGIGTGIIIDQKIDPAFEDSEGGQIEVEYEGKMQTWESFASGRAIVERYNKRAGEITDQATRNAIAHAIAVGLIDLIATVQPQVIVLGGSVGHYYERFATPLNAELKKFETPIVPIPEIRGAERPDDAVVYGCYDLAKSIYGNADR
ncbi:MAG TPA: ROK family protein [Candidatus Saccharimonadales bacterium]